MKIAVFTDIHGNYQALSSILSDINNKKFDKVICLGDNIGLGPSSNECLKELNDTDIIMITGNHELYYTKGIDKDHVENKNILEHNNWIHTHMHEPVSDDLLKYEISFNNKKVLFVHFFLNEGTYPFESSHIFDDESYKKVFDRYDYDAVLYGHRHMERTDKYNNNTYYGLLSSGCTKDDITYYYIVDINDEINVEKVELKYDRDTFVNIFKNTNFPEKGHIGDFFFGIKE